MTIENGIELTVIVPVWKTPIEMVKKSIDSVLGCNAFSMEILVVDDGNSLQYAEELDHMAENDGRLKILHRKHKGVSAARNEGVRLSKGEYITFLDADDEFYTEALRKVKNVIQSSASDLIISRISRKSNCDSQRIKVWKDSPELRRSLRLYYISLHNPDFRDKDCWINRAPHGRFIRRNLALQFPMKEDLSFGEDVIWNFELLNNAADIMVLNLQTYFYRKTSFSATQAVRKQFPEEIKNLLRYYKQEIDTWPREDKKFFEAAALEYFTILMRLYIFAGRDKYAWAKYRKVVKDPFWKEVFSNCELDILYGRLRMTDFLCKYHLYGMFYIISWLYDRFVRKKFL